METNLEPHFAELRRRFGESSVTEQIDILAELKQTVVTWQWSQFSNGCEEFGILISELTETAPPTLAWNLADTLQTAANRYARDISDSELTCIHVSLAAHCRKHHFYSSNILALLKLYQRESRDLMIPLDFNSDTANYFEDCSHIYACVGNWRDAAIHAALALTLLPNNNRFRVWYLAEFIANGRVSPLPRAAWTNASCPLVSEFGQLLERKTHSNWLKLNFFCKEHQDELERLKIASLVRRCLAAFCVQCIELTLERVVSAPTTTILNPYLETGMTMTELQNAGLAKFTEEHNGIIAPHFRSEHTDARTNEKAELLLQRVASYSAALQKEVYN